MPRRPFRWTATHVLLGLAVTELAVNRVAVPMLRPVGSPPLWHTALDYLGLFSFYFVGTLSALLVLARAWAGVRAPEDRRSRVAAIALAVAGALASIPLVVDAPAELSVPLEAAFAGAVIALVVASGGRQRDLGLQLATPVFVAPLLLHSVGVIGGRFLWPDNTFDGAGYVIAQAALMALCLAALITPYGFSPRPFARAIVRPAPVLAAIATSIAGAYLARASYPFVLRATQLAIGIELTPGQPDPRLSMYLLALATLVWTLVACARASTPARRSIGQGLALIALAGFAFKWPHHYLLSLLGLARIADAARTVRDEERAASPLASATPPIADAAWSAFIAQLTSGLGRVLTDVHSLTARGEGGLASSVIVGAAAGLAVRARIDRIDGCVLGLDVVLGRERDEATPATLTLWSVAPRALGTNPASPPATPAFRCGDDPFDARFRLRGSAPAFARLFDDGLRARAVASIDGWLAYWDGVGLRYRVYPGRGAPLDHPLPLSDLALGRAAATPERMIAVIELLVELAGRAGVAATAEPSTLPDAAALAEPAPG